LESTPPESPTTTFFITSNYSAKIQNWKLGGPEYFFNDFPNSEHLTYSPIRIRYSTAFVSTLMKIIHLYSP
ncbi:MAG: hypothetical protein R3299_09295, partial [Arenibacter sp.]|nr:hypothetical protein [Arenibacter sp.]